MSYVQQACPFCRVYVATSIEAEIGHMASVHRSVIQERMKVAGLDRYYHFSAPPDPATRAIRLRGALLAAGLRSETVDAIEIGEAPSRYHREGGDGG